MLAGVRGLSCKFQFVLHIYCKIFCHLPMFAIDNRADLWPQPIAAEMPLWALRWRALPFDKFIRRWQTSICCLNKDRNDGTTLFCCCMLQTVAALRAFLNNSQSNVCKFELLFLLLHLLILCPYGWRSTVKTAHTHTHTLSICIYIQPY